MRNQGRNPFCGTNGAVGPVARPSRRASRHRRAGEAQDGAASVIGGGKFQNGAATGAFNYLFNHMGHMMTGMDAHNVLAEHLAQRDARVGIWTSNTTFGGTFGTGRPDLIYTGGGTTNSNVYELKPLGHEAEAQSQLQGYPRSSTALNTVAGDLNFVFRDASPITPRSQWFLGRTTYTYTPGSVPGVVLYSVDRTSVFQEDYRAFQAKPKGAPMPFPLPVPVPPR
jgi:hypothetical protein